ncbi:hypothetical protein NX059_001370 [Plenodomus lindquistii]|nr:hypothetical protein NX059_001370 [Plenodomus lindquistii]
MDANGTGDSLPLLTPDPIAYSGCCLALSKPLVDYVSTLLPPPPSFALSIGSGFGLLEAHLATGAYNVYVVGVEVAPSSNVYLCEQHHRVVSGSRFLDPLAAKATAWLFIYPRRVGLVHEYLLEYGGLAVDTVIWAGPKADWDDYKDCFTVSWEVDVHSADEIGGRAWELVAIAKKARA